MQQKKPTTRKEFKEYIKNVVDFSTLPESDIVLTCWFGRSGQSFSFGKIQKLFDLTDEKVRQIASLANSYMKLNNEHGGSDFLGHFFYLDSFKRVLKQPGDYSKGVQEKFSVGEFVKIFKLHPNVILK